MANRTTNKDGGQPNSRLRVFYIELDGSDATIAEELYARSNACDGPRTVSSPSGINSSQKPPEKGSTAQVDPMEPEVADEFQNGDDQTELEVQDQPARQRRGQAPKRDRNAE